MVSLRNPAVKEKMLADEYILLYLSHKKKIIDRNNDDGEKLIYSKLSIKNNKAQLDVNLMNSEGNKKIEPEYSYQGDINLTRNIIHISLSDTTKQEHVDITLRRPSVEDGTRFIGIMTALSQNGQPVAFKCACIQTTFFSQIKIQNLKQILGNNTGENSFMFLEEKDIETFYSKELLL